MNKNINIVCYSPGTGEISHTCLTQKKDMEKNIDPGMSCLVTDDEADAATTYIVGDSIVKRPVMPLTGVLKALNVNGVMLIRGIPVGTTFFHPDGEDVIDDQFVEWETNVAGVYILRFKLFPYQEVHIRVKVQA